MIDYISTTTSFSGKDNIFYTHLQLEAVYNSGWRKYHLEGCEKLSVRINPSLRMMSWKAAYLTTGKATISVLTEDNL